MYVVFDNSYKHKVSEAEELQLITSKKSRD